MILLEVHGWRGLGRDRDLFRYHLRCGFVSIAWDRTRVSDLLRSLEKKIDELRKSLTG